MTHRYDEFHSSFAKTRPQERLIDRSSFTYINFFRFVLPVIEAAQPGHILDIGSGAGTISLFLGNLGYHTAGVDISPIAVGASRDSARSMGLEDLVSFVHADFSRLEMETRFDVVLCLEVIEHLEEDDRFLSQVTGVLRESGLLIISAPLSTAPLTRLGLTNEFDSTVGHLRRYREDQLIRKIENAGFGVERVTTTEGILRNSLFVFKPLHVLVRCVRGRFITRLITAVDDLAGMLLGCSDIIIVARKS